MCSLVCHDLTRQYIFHSESNIGFTATKANLLTIPPYAWGCVTTVAVGILGDRIGTRYYMSL